MNGIVQYVQAFTGFFFPRHNYFAYTKGCMCINSLLNITLRHIIILSVSGVYPHLVLEVQTGLVFHQRF